MEPDDDNDTAEPDANATGLIIIGVLGFLVIVGFLYTTMTG